MGWRTTALWPACGEGFEGVFDGGADPGGAGYALALEGEDQSASVMPTGASPVGDEPAAVRLHSTG